MTDERPTERRGDVDPTVQGTSEREHVLEFGPYRLHQKVGEGGMGEVWLAEQSRPMRRKVALKIIKRGMDSQEIVARFEAERQALALMNHANVAKVFDAGTTPDGRPYFVMEYVPGAPIVEYCDRHRLGLRARLDIFRRVCDGVQHAHQKAIIHRDLKPSNVLVMEEDGTPTPKIIDFGVAKATSQKLTERTMFTQLGVLIGTPEYMSPEQAELTGEDVDTRTDVYSLGVILYELLVGALPFDARELREAGFEGIRRIIREKEPVRPSTRVSTLGDSATDTARKRSLAAPALRTRLNGDLDWITMKALEKDRGRRYASPGDLSRDIERHLTDLPIEARPPTLSYRAGRFVRRNRVGVTFASVLLVLVLGASGALAVLYARSVEAERVAAKEAETSSQALEFMVDLFRGADPFTVGGEPMTALDLLDVGAERIEALDDQPEVQIDLMETIGDVYRELGDYVRARALIEGALERQIAYTGREHVDTALRLFRLGYLDVLSENYERADASFAEAYAIREAVEDRPNHRWADLLHMRAFVRVRQTKFEEAVEFETRALEMLERYEPEMATSRADYLHILGWAYAGLEQLDEARETFGESLRLRQSVTGYETPATGWSLNMLGRSLALLGDPDEIREGIGHLQEALALNTRLFGEVHPEIAYNWINMAHGHARLGDLEEAARCYRTGLTIGRQVLSETGAMAAASRRLAQVLEELDRKDAAIDVLEDHLARLDGLGAEAGGARQEARALLARLRDPDVDR